MKIERTKINMSVKEGRRDQESDRRRHAACPCLSVQARFTDKFPDLNAEKETRCCFASQHFSVEVKIQITFFSIG